MRHYPKEFGGILMGYYSDDLRTCNVTDIILPNNYKSSQYNFERGDDGLYEIMEMFYNKNPKQIYIGEWHTHPDMLPIPSATDKNALNEIINNSQVNINNPILLIIGNKKTGYSFACYVQYKNNLYVFKMDN